jgi:hypothetical protein
MPSKKIRPSALFVNLIAGAAIVIISAAISPSANAATNDACSLLSPAQVSAAAGVSVGAGTYATAIFKKTCTWGTSGNDAKTAETITLLLQSPEAFENGKRFGGAKSAAVTAVSGVGDEAYYLVIGTTVSMAVKKGNVAFKVTVYASGISAEKKQAIERTLARQVVGRL